MLVPGPQGRKLRPDPGLSETVQLLAPAWTPGSPSQDLSTDGSPGSTRLCAAHSAPTAPCLLLSHPLLSPPLLSLWAWVLGCLARAATTQVLLCVPTTWGTRGAGGLRVQHVPSEGLGHQPPLLQGLVFPGWLGSLQRREPLLGLRRVSEQHRGCRQDEVTLAEGPGFVCWTLGALPVVSFPPVAP